MQYSAPEKATLIGTGIAFVVGCVTIYSFIWPKSTEAAPTAPTTQITAGNNSPNIGTVQGDYVGGDKVAGDKFSGDKVGGDKVGGDKFGGDKVAGDKNVNIYPSPPAVKKAANPNVAKLSISGGWKAVTRPRYKVGDRLRVTSRGQVKWGYGNQVSGPEGVPIGLYPYVAPPVPDRNRVGALIGRFGNGTPFVIGEEKTITVKSGGLALAINDAYPDNNSGSFAVTVELKK